MKSEWYTAEFIRLDSNGKAREIRFGKEQSLQTEDRREAFETCQKTANETGEGITLNLHIRKTSSPPAKSSIIFEDMLAHNSMETTIHLPAMGVAFYGPYSGPTNKYHIYPEPDHRQRAGGAANKVQDRDETV